jgi:hypothetical protein
VTVTEDVIARFITRFTRDASGCWTWTGGRSGYRYGGIVVSGRQVKAHRLSYELHVGPIPAGLTLDHLCRNTLCVNPAHLEPVTHAENVRRGMSPSAICARKTHCIHGHPFSGENLGSISARGGFRVCLACKREWHRVNADKINAKRRAGIAA